MDFPVFELCQLARRIQTLRKARSMTQAELGRRLGVEEARIADFENDPGSLTVAQLHQLLVALGAQIVIRDKMNGWPMPSFVPTSKGRTTK